MLLRLTASLLITLLTGYALISLLWPRESFGMTQFLLKVSLAVGLGSGASSFIVFLVLLVLGPPGTQVIAVATVLCALTVATAMLRNRHKATVARKPRITPDNSRS